MKPRPDLRQALLSPRSVAIIGQSNDAGKTAGRPLAYLRQAGYAGRIYPVNARRETVLDERAWPAIEALPEIPDHAYIVTPTDAAVAAAEACGRFGVPVATILADGFTAANENGTARLARQDALRREQSIFGDLAYAFGRRGVQAMIIETAIPEIEEEANRILARMTDGRMHVKFETQRDARYGLGTMMRR